MKARSSEFVDRAVAATTAALEIYNKPSFPYKAEAFCILAVNGWELLLKAKWLKEHKNKVQSLYVSEFRPNKDGQRSKQATYKKSARSGNPITHGLDFLAKQLVEQKHLNPTVGNHLEALLEMRNSAVHFYLAPSNTEFITRLHALAAASIQNFSLIVRDWFGRDLSELDLNLVPLALLNSPQHTRAVVLTPTEKNFLQYLLRLDTQTSGPDADYAVMLDVAVAFTRSKERSAAKVQVTSDPNAPEVRLSDSQILDKYPWDYQELTKQCKSRYAGFKCNREYHQIRKNLLGNSKFCYTRLLNPANLRSTRIQLYNSSILAELDKHYQKK